MTTAQTTDISNDSRLKRPNSMWSQTIFKYDKFGPLGNPRIWAKSKDISMQFATLRESLGQRRDDDDSLQYKEGDFHRLRSKTLKICCLSSLYKESDKKSSVEEHGDKHGVMWLMASVALAEAGNPVKKILLKLNLSDHRLCKMVMECQSVKVKNFKKDATLKLFKNGMSMLVQKSQVHKMAKLQVGMEIMLG
ncbi:hypothetical protein Tco_1483795 [Tanacetum coccineum]